MTLPEVPQRQISKIINNSNLLGPVTRNHMSTEAKMTPAPAPAPEETHMILHKMLPATQAVVQLRTKRTQMEMGPRPLVVEVSPPVVTIKSLSILDGTLPGLPTNWLESK